MKAQNRPRGIARPLDVDEQQSAGEGNGKGGEIARASEADQCDADSADEFNCRHQRDRQAVERQVEGTIHHRQAGAEGQEQQSRWAIGAGDGSPWAGQRREDQRCGGDAQPRHAEHADMREKQHGECRPQVMEDGADTEPDMRRQFCS